MIRSATYSAVLLLIIGNFTAALSDVAVKLLDGGSVAVPIHISAPILINARYLPILVEAEFGEKASP